MRLLTKMLKQTALYWEPDGSDGYGAFKFKTPVEIKCRWEDCNEQGLGLDGKETMFDSTVFAGEDLRIGGLLLLATLADLDGVGEPPEAAKRIRKFEKVPTIRARQFLRVAYL
jgi:hypothetical protein